MIDNQYKGRLATLYDRVLRHRKMTIDKSNTLWNINLNVSARSMKGILMFLENVAAQQPFARSTEAFYNPQTTKVEVTIEVIPNKLYSQLMRAYQKLDEAKKYFAASPGSKRQSDLGTVAIAITRKMDCDDWLLSAKGTGDEAPSEKPVATTYLQNQEEPDRVQKQRERLASVAAGGQEGRYGYLFTEQH